jgi:opacity protein-like surface antigen
MSNTASNGDPTAARQHGRTGQRLRALPPWRRAIVPLHRIAAAAAVMSTAITAAAAAQVGHNPLHSPYHDLRVTHQFTFSGGYLGGGGGAAGIGPRDGPVEGLRYSLSLSAPLELTAGVYAGQLTRYLVDPTAPVGQRDAGTVTQSVFIADAGFNLRITGAKTWHGFVPYVGFSFGVASGSSVIEDNSGFSFHRPFQYGPHLGVRYYRGSSVSLWVEGWDPMWRLRYPLNFFAGTTPVIDPSAHGQTQWVHNPTLLVGLGISIGS